MFCLRGATTLLLLACVPIVAAAQAKKKVEHIVIYKDGFFLRGKVGEEIGEVIYDSKSGMSFPILAGKFFLNDGVRTIFFGHGQVQKVVPLESTTMKPIVRFDYINPSREILSQWVFDAVTEWNDKGERTVHVDNSKGRGGQFEMKQRIALLTPQYAFACTTDYKWELAYSPQEFGPAKTRAIILQIFSERKAYKEMSAAQRYLEVAKFMQEAGWYDDAERELVETMQNYPAEKKIAEERLANVRQIRANLVAEGIQQAVNIGQHQVALDRLGFFDKGESEKHLSQKHRLIVGDVKTEYEKAKERIKEAKRFLNELPRETGKTAVWTKASELIQSELNYDTIGIPKGKLDTFLDFARQYELDVKNKRKPGQSAEQVLALAVSGWLQGNQAAEPDPKLAQSLLAARQFVLEYLRTDFGPKRATMLSEFRAQHNLPVDVMARLLKMIPPSHALESDSVTTRVMTMQVEAPESVGGSYLVQLPPDYHHLRAHPVLMVFHSGRDKPEDTLRRFSDEAAKHGFILVAPLWTGSTLPLKARYRYSDREHQLVLDTLRDLRRRFQVDSDRVFLFGSEDGGNLVFDVGLAHPDLFAGLVPMSGGMMPFTRRFYWPHAQYLPIYLIDGDRNGNAAKINRDIFNKDWGRDPYQFTYVEYHGRGSEWYGAEIPQIMSWVSRKKRKTPMKELGRASTTGGLGEEFRSSRELDNHFYWLSGSGFLDRNQHDHISRFDGNFKPATFQANLAVGNLLVKNEAKTWYQIGVRTTGMKHATLWITPNMMELPNLLTVRFNGQEVLSKRMVEPSLDVMMEELYRSGDRQRLYVAKFDFRPL